MLSLATYVYDVFGNRIEEDVWTPSSGTTVSRFAYMTLPSPLRGEGQGEGPSGYGPQGGAGQGAEEIWADLNGSNGLVTRYLHGDAVNQLFARVSAAGVAAWYLTDHQGSVTNLTDASGNLQDTITYDGYGNVTSESNPSFGDRFKYTGEQLESETGLQLNRARYYDPVHGRWTSQDPLGFQGGDANLYRYVDNDPTGAIDPDGLQSYKSAFYERVPLYKGGLPLDSKPPKGDYILTNPRGTNPEGYRPEVPQGRQGPANYLQFKGGSGNFQGGYLKAPRTAYESETRWISPFRCGRTLYFDQFGNYKGAIPSPGTYPPYQPSTGDQKTPLGRGTNLLFGPDSSAPDEGSSFIKVVPPGYQKGPYQPIVTVPKR